MKKTLIPLLAALVLCGCKTPLMTPAQLTTTVAGGVSLGLSVYPQAAPDVALARDIICDESGTPPNADPAAIVADLEKAGITNSNSKIIVTGALFVYEQVYYAVPTNSYAVYNTYLTALCTGMTQALPPPPPAGKSKKLVPYLK